MVTNNSNNYSPVNHNSLVGATNGGITSVAPSATSGIPLVSNGAAADPSFTTAVVAGGGTGIVTTTAYGVITGGTTATGNFQNAGAGTAGQILQSGGAAALPAYVNSKTVGSLVWLSSQTASNSATINFTSLISATYSTYFITFSNVVPVSTSSLNAKVSTDNGATYIATNYQSGLFIYPYNSGTGIANVANATTFYYVTGNINLSSAGSAGYFWLYNTQNGQQSLMRGESTDVTTIVNSTYVCGGNSTTSVNAFQFLMSTGNISTGKFTLYGLIE